MAVEAVFRRKSFADIAEDLLRAAREPAAGRPPLTDGTEGSVVLTLLEAFARELAVGYEQLDIVYRQAYLDTADGASLDNVVALLGLRRKRGGFLVGTVEFSRGQAAAADIVIPAGTLVAGPKAPLFQTTADTVLVAGTTIASAGVQSVDPGKPAVAGGAIPAVPAKTLSIMPRPIAGIEQVTNPGPLIVRQAPESDDELRARARQTVRGANTGTVGALEQAVLSCGVAGVKVLEDTQNNPGALSVVFDTTGIAAADMNDTLALIRARVGQVRPAGVRVTVGPAARIEIRLAAVLHLNQEYSPSDQLDILARTKAALSDYFAQLAVGETIRSAKVRSVLTADPRIVDVAGLDNAPLMDPFRDGVSVAARSRLSNDDILIRADERAFLLDTAPWPKLAPESPGVRVDATIVQTGQDPAVAASVRVAAAAALTAYLGEKTRELDRAEKPGSGVVSPPDIGFTELSAAVRAENVASAVFTVVHERDGRAVVLASTADRDRFAARERPRTGIVLVNPSAAPPHG